MPVQLPPSPPTQPAAPPGRRHTLWALLAFYAIAPLYAVAIVQERGDRGVDLFFGLVLNVILSCWAFADARRRGRPIPAMSRTWFFLFAWCMVPGYVIQTRGWRGVGWLALHGVVWVALGIATAVALELMTFAARGLR
jgi:hypothetical protein